MIILAICLYALVAFVAFWAMRGFREKTPAALGWACVWPVVLFVIGCMIIGDWYND